ncbi:MAG: amidohydrolase family protein [Chitinophagaceae bacterium]|nr:amidohydrolase family protein [Chitinophagaceae bacterium]
MLLFPLAISAQVLIKNTNVLDVENRTILAGHSVVVLDGKIVSVDKDRMYKLPPGTKVIDGTGKFLIPGLTDAHIHFIQSGGLFARPDAIDLRAYQPYEKEVQWVHDHMSNLLRRYLSAGITSVIDVGSTLNFLTQKDSFRTKTWSPLISMSGPLLTTWIPDAFKQAGKDNLFMEMITEEGTRQSIREQIPYKPDFIKIWYIVTDSNIERGASKNLPLIKAAIDEAHKNNLRVAVHATERITAQLAVEAGADFLVHNVEDEVVSDAFVQLLKNKNIVITPTQVVAGHYYKVFGDKYKFTTDELRLAHPVPAGSVIDFPWPDTARGARYIRSMSRPTTEARMRMEDSIRRINLQRLSAAGVIIATGTDAGNIGTQHAASYFVELKAMADAGLTPWQLLEASTINGAKAVGKDQEWGSITKDKIGNMVLLRANPLMALENWRKIDWVINKGVAYRPDSIIINTPADLAQAQLNAYNAHDLDAFLAPYSEDVEIYELPGKLVSKGKSKMRATYQFITRNPNLYCRLLKRIVQGNTVIDHEEIWGAGEKPFYGIAIYVIEKGKISKVYFPKP